MPENTYPADRNPVVIHGVPEEGDVTVRFDPAETAEGSGSEGSE